MRGVLKKIGGFVRPGVWQKTTIRSAALAFFTVMSLVPILALIFVIFKGFGVEHQLSEHLYELLPAYTDAVDQIVVFIQNLLARTRGGVMAAVAIFVLIWAVVQVFGNIESAFNDIWQVERSRSFARRFTAYMAVMILAPILLLVANSLYVGIRSQIEIFTGSLFVEILFSLVGIALVVLMFSLVYCVVPNTEVKYHNALWASLVAGVAFCAFQVAYIFIQTELNAYNAIYGTFAAIPLFLLWLQVSWQILLFGGEFSFELQNRCREPFFKKITTKKEKQ